MLTKDQLLELMTRECDICIHLHGKIPAGSLEFRFTPPQRSTTELLRYLSFIGLGASRSIIAGSWDPYQALVKEAATLDPAKFPAAMEQQKRDLRALFEATPEADFAAKTFQLPWGETKPLGQSILALAYGALVAYRMQLFLQAKAAGAAALTTSNCWGGRDMPA